MLQHHVVQVVEIIQQTQQIFEVLFAIDTSLPYS